MKYCLLFFLFLSNWFSTKNCWHLCLPPSSKTLHWHELQMYLLNSSQMSSSVERKTSEISMKWREVKLLLCWFMLPPFIYLLYFFFWRLTCLNSLWHDAVKKLVITYTWVTSCKNVNYTKMLVAFKGTVSQIYVSFFSGLWLNVTVKQNPKPNNLFTGVTVVSWELRLPVVFSHVSGLLPGWGQLSRRSQIRYIFV